MTYIIKISNTKEKRTINTIIKNVFECKPKEYDTINLLKIKNGIYVRITYSKGKQVEYGYNPDLEFYTKPANTTFYNESLKKDIKNKKLKVVSLPEFIEILKYKEPEQYIKIKLMTKL